MIRYALRVLRARLASGLVLYALTVAGAALGVASVLSIQIISASAIGAFAASVRAVSGDAGLSVVGRGPSFPEALYPAVLAEPGVAAAWPLYRIDVAVAGREGLYLEVAGVDVFATAPMPWREAPADVAAALREPGWVAITPELAARLGRRVGDALDVTSGSRRARLRIGALVDWRRRSPGASARLAVMDIAQAQGRLGEPGRLHQIDVRLAPGTYPGELAARLGRRLGPGVRVLTPGEREAQAAGLLAAFRLNLTALSLVSLLVGLFLVHQATGALLVRRRAEFGLLRALGATRRQVLGLLVGEVVVLGALGVALGVPLGYWVASRNVGRVSATLTNLYLLEEIQTLVLPPRLVGLAALIGVGGAVAGGILPALDLARRPPTALLAAFTVHAAARSRARPLFGAGLGVLAAAGAWFAWLGHGWRPAGFVLGVSILAALPLLTPAVVAAVAGRLRVRRFGPAYAVRGLAARLETTSFAVASLAIAVSMLVGITLMIGSFRRTLEVWVASTVRADVYVTTQSWARGTVEATLAPELVGALRAHPAVAYVDRLRRLSASVGERRVAVLGVDMALPGREERFPLLAGSPPDALRRVRDGGAVLVSEPLARKAGLRPGDTLPVLAAGGAVALPVAGVYADYSSESGAIAMDLATLAARFGAGPVHSVALYLRPGADPERVIEELRARTGGAPLVFRSNRRLRAEVFRIFDQTFAVTRLLQGMALLIAVAGITLSLLVLARERVFELALYRSLGATRRQLFRLFVGKAIGLAGIALGLGLAGGIGLAAVLVLVINRAYFGWTIQMHWPWGGVLEQLAAILAAAVVAGLYPALAASATPAVELSREDLA